CMRVSSLMYRQYNRFDVW
nr:immunoglobulin heavy chain junction region [Macaca mulatta]MOY23400.1 immunoglobulin heavy chain junction region [Macaca mulatta]MOY23966.1 immunoglobulin heavy chain junction region [Macaca mulatta]MOY25271.1 immunoglobulin heavy chain junction region [Macaca mulatta]MOY25731.1 immunoglobulin heavy chain junction region [Macaca mulatta]